MPLMKELSDSDEPSLVSKELWRPSSPQNTQISHFMTTVSKKHGINLGSYSDLWQWSVSEPAQFWEEIWHHTSIKAHKPFEQVSTPT